MNKTIILGSLLVVLLAIGGVFALTDNSKVNTEINFLSDSNLNNGDHIEILLKDTNGNPLSEQNIAIVYEANGNEEYYYVITDSEGKAYLTLTGDATGAHKVTVKYDGNDKYNSCVSEETIVIKEGVSQERTSTKSTATASTVKYHTDASSSAQTNKNYQTNNNNNYQSKQNNYKSNSTYKNNQNYNSKRNSQPSYNSKSYDPKKEYATNLYYDNEAKVYYDDFGRVYGGKYDGKEIVDVRANNVNHKSYQK